MQKLAQAAEFLREKGYSLLIWDGYRPVYAQFALWDIYPDGNFVANPNTGFSKHNRGSAIDLTLVLLDGTPVSMPTDFDDFTAKADRDYSDVSPEAAANALLLQQVMECCGFSGYSKEWWHFNDTDTYDVPQE